MYIRAQLWNTKDMKPQNPTILSKKAYDNIFIPTYNFDGSEKDIEEHILENIESISKECGWGDVQRVETQYVIKCPSTEKRQKKIRIDIFVWHTDGSGTVIEVKSVKNKNRTDSLTAVSQSLHYGYVVEAFLGHLPRIVVAANEISGDVYETIKRFNLPICLLMVDGDRCVYLK
jgi:hypothetical protein